MFRKKNRENYSYDPATQQPVIKCSICTGEQVAGFRDLNTGGFTDVMLIGSDGDLRAFKERYGISCDIEKIY